MNLKKLYIVLRYMSKDSEKQAKPIFFDKNGNLMLHIFAKPGAKANGITGIEDEGIGVKINARAVEGEANSELITYLTKLFGLKKNEISLEKGMKSRQKIVQITKKGFTYDEIVNKLKEEMEQ